MKRLRIWIGATMMLVLIGIAFAGKPVDESQLGLSKTSVFATPDPIVATVKAEAPGENENIGSYFSGAPPLVPHLVEDFLPIRVGENMCADCHLLPEMIGEPAEAGLPTPIPASHYTDLRREPNKVTKKLIGARYVCTQCHVAQVESEPLVLNTYRQ